MQAGDLLTLVQTLTFTKGLAQGWSANSPVPVCNWTGVTCNTDGTFGLDLSSTGMTGMHRGHALPVKQRDKTFRTSLHSCGQHF